MANLLGKVRPGEITTLRTEECWNRESLKEETYSLTLVGEPFVLLLAKVERKLNSLVHGDPKRKVNVRQKNFPFSVDFWNLVDTNLQMLTLEG